MIGTARSRVDFFTNKFSDFQFSVVFDVAARERLIMRLYGDHTFGLRA